jgi:chemotaxis protein methyltransferase CheR
MVESIMNNPLDKDITAAQMAELQDILYHLYGFDFSNYSKASLKRRLVRIMSKYNYDYYSLKSELTNNEGFFQEFLNEVTVNVTEMFRDSLFYKALSAKVIPYLASYPYIRVWNAGCSTGEETYSFAIMLKEQGLLHRSFLYGTDVNSKVLETATEGIYPAANIKLYSQNYINAGGKGSLSDYYYAAYDSVIINNELKQKTLFSTHNLVSDKVFNEFQLVVCRNVLIYFDSELQNHVIKLLYDSLCPLGFLCLGSKEVIRNEILLSKFKVIDKQQKIYQKIS